MKPGVLTSSLQLPCARAINLTTRQEISILEHISWHKQVTRVFVWHQAVSLDPTTQLKATVYQIGTQKNQHCLPNASKNSLPGYRHKAMLYINLLQDIPIRITKEM